MSQLTIVFQPHCFDSISNQSPGVFVKRASYVRVDLCAVWALVFGHLLHTTLNAGVPLVSYIPNQTQSDPIRLCPMHVDQTLVFGSTFDCTR